MAMDEVLLALAATTGRPVLRFYAWTQPAATFGYFQTYSEIARLTSLRPLIRRPTGGGLVPHDADWTYSIAVPPGHPWYALSATASYERVHDWLRRAFAHCGVATALAPCCNPAGPGQCFVGAEKHDLLQGTHKIAGAAQRRNRDGLLIQGSVQPPPPGLTRDRWEQAMQQVGSGAPSVFAAWVLPTAYAEAATHATALRYARQSYNQRR